MTLQDRARLALREPLVHFLLGGALIFAFFAWQGEEADPASRVIEVDEEVQAQLALTFERTMQRPPIDAELDLLIERHVREEVLYREALRLGLDAGDPVVRRRLAKKMDFIAASSAQASEPGDAELAGWFAANAARYAADTTLTFDQVYFAEQPDAAAARKQLAQDWQAAGDPVSLPASVEARPLASVAAQFGQAFADRVAAMAPGNGWEGPIQSGVGWHFLRLREVDPGEIPSLDSLRERVIEDWRLETSAAREEDAYRLLREAYEVRVAR